MRAWRFGFVADNAIFDTIVCQDFLGNCIGLALRNLAEQDILSSGSNIIGFNTHIGNRCHYRFSYGVGNAAF